MVADSCVAPWSVTLSKIIQIRSVTFTFIEKIMCNFNVDDTSISLFETRLKAKQDALFD